MHKARLHDGTEVAVKVQYAGLQTAVAADLGTFAALSAAAAWLLPDYQVPASLPSLHEAVAMARAAHQPLCSS